MSDDGTLLALGVVGFLALAGRRRGSVNVKPTFVVRSVAQGKKLIEHPDILANHEKSLRVKRRHKIAVLLPCAGTKPFPQSPSHKHGYLPALKGKDADIYVVAEPLGVIPYAWSTRYPNNAYDFPPRYLKDDAFDLLASRVRQWLARVGSRYERIVLALPIHHRRLVMAAAEGSDLPLEDASITACRTENACDSGTFRATGADYRRWLASEI